MYSYAYRMLTCMCMCMDMAMPMPTIPHAHLLPARNHTGFDSHPLT